MRASTVGRCRTKEALASVNPGPIFKHYGENVWAAVRPASTAAPAARSIPDRNAPRLSSLDTHLDWDHARTPKVKIDSAGES